MKRNSEIGEAFRERFGKTVGFTSNHEKCVFFFRDPGSGGLALGRSTNHMDLFLIFGEKRVVFGYSVEMHVKNAPHGTTNNFGAEEIGSMPNHGHGSDA